MNEPKKNNPQNEPPIEVINLAIKYINENDLVRLKETIDQMIEKFSNGSTSWLFSAIYYSLINELNISENHLSKVLKSIQIMVKLIEFTQIF